MAYAEGTSVSIEKSQMEIAGMIRKYGAESFGTGWSNDHAIVTFNAHNRQIRFVLPTVTDWRQFTLTPSKQRRTEASAKSALDAENKRRWRAMALAIKAKLEVVETGIATFEQTFAHVMGLTTHRRRAHEGWGHVGGSTVTAAAE